MPMPMLNLVAEDGIVLASENHSRLTIMPSPMTALPELLARARRSTFTAQEKLCILAETDRAAQMGGIGAVLRWEGIYI